MSSNRRIYYAVQQVGMNIVGQTAFTVVHGVQSLGVSTKYNLEQIFEMGQLAIYANMETVPDVEITLSKALDGYPLIYHLATQGSPTASLAGRSNAKAALAMSIFSDFQDSASGTPITQMVASGVFCQNVEYRQPLEGAATESVTLVGNNKYWLSSAFTFNGTATNTDTPLAGVASGLVQHRQDLLFYPASAGGPFTVLPLDIPGISASGTNDLQVDGNYPAHLNSWRASANLGRSPLYELGRKAPFFRYVQFPVQVTTEIEVLSLSGDQMTAVETAITNVNTQAIKFVLREGTKVDLGNQNKCQSVTHSGGNAQQGGGNVTVTYNYLTFNDFTITHPADPTTALAQRN